MIKRTFDGWKCRRTHTGHKTGWNHTGTGRLNRWYRTGLCDSSADYVCPAATLTIIATGCEQGERCALTIVIERVGNIVPLRDRGRIEVFHIRTKQVEKLRAVVTIGVC